MFARNIYNTIIKTIKKSTKTLIRLDEGVTGANTMLGITWRSVVEEEKLVLLDISLIYPKYCKITVAVVTPRIKDDH